MKRHLSRAAWVLVVLLLLAVVAWTAGNLIGSSRYESARAELEADGFVLQPHLLAPPPLPASENSAPYYSAAFALHVFPPEDATWETKTWREMSPEDRTAAGAWLGRNAEAFDLVRRAQKRPQCRFERDYMQGYSLPLPEISKVLGLSRAFAMLSGKQTADGDAAAARESVKLIFALAESLRDDAILVSFLVRLVAAESALTALDDAVTGRTGEEDLRAWLSLLPPATFLQGGLERAYRGEIVMAGGLLQNPVSETLTLLEGVGNPAPHVAWDLMRPILRYDGADYLHEMRRLALASRKPFLEADAEIASGVGKPASFWSPVRSLLLPGQNAGMRRQARVEARLAVVRAGLEAELALKATGAYPESVRGVDPFSGKPPVTDLGKGRIASVRATEGPEDKPTEWRLRATK